MIFVIIFENYVDKKKQVWTRNLMTITSCEQLSMQNLKVVPNKSYTREYKSFIWKECQPHFFDNQHMNMMMRVIHALKRLILLIFARDSSLSSLQAAMCNHPNKNHRVSLLKHSSIQISQNSTEGKHGLCNYHDKTKLYTQMTKTWRRKNNLLYLHITLRWWTSK